MASLKEIKGRIASVSSTLKITSAMKLVASAKLRKAQQAITNMLPYERQLQSILDRLMAAGLDAGALDAGASLDAGAPAVPGRVHSRFAAAEYGLGTAAAPAVIPGSTDDPLQSRIAIVAFSSNSSLCGAFNSNVIRKTLGVIDEYRSAGFPDDDIVVYSVGRKIAEAMRKAGFQSPADYSKMADSPGYDAASALAQELIEGFTSGRFSKVELVYNHFKSTASQPTVRETFLPMASVSNGAADGTPPVPGRIHSRFAAADFGLETAAMSSQAAGPVILSDSEGSDVIIEPSRSELLAELLPKVQRLKIYTTLLDSNAAEHAARTVAMQTATDNGNDLLEQLTLEYNKGRQQKITSEILDIVGGTLQ
ncbi:MAG: F0F1 ATP synthase subunit gamma [Bacteroidales bacterium]|nr:F0F1 ATP synthase subunit gamma [Bacteroidales bacterium]